LVSDGEINMRNVKAALVLERLAQVVEKNKMTADSFDTVN
jgi:hypothetical protein